MEVYKGDGAKFSYKGSALFRSLGVGASFAVWAFWCEQLVLVLAGNVLGCLAALLVGEQGIQEIMAVCGAAFGGYMLGTTVALLLLAREAAGAFGIGVGYRGKMLWQ